MGVLNQIPFLHLTRAAMSHMAKRGGQAAGPPPEAGLSEESIGRAEELLIEGQDMDDGIVAALNVGLPTIEALEMQQVMDDGVAADIMNSGSHNLHKP
jgi:hypothetical protein